MDESSGNAASNAYFTISFGGFTQVQMAQPTCNACTSSPILQDQLGRLWCQPCLDEFNRAAAVKDAQNWIAAAFFATKRARWARLYKHLSAAFHPDQGGDSDLMIALNLVRERFPS